MGELIHILATNEELVAAAVDLSERRAQTYLSEERKQQISRQMAYIFFELECRNEVVLLDPPEAVKTS